MNIAQFSVERPVAVTMRIAGLVLLGGVCLTRLPVDLLPNVTIPTVAVVTQWPNVSPEEMETQVTRPIEEAVSSTPNMYLVSSSSTEGSSSVRVQFNWGTDIGQGAVDVLQEVQRARRQFPTDPTLQEPTVFKYDPTTLPILIYGVSGISDPVKLRTLIDNEVTPIIESANGVASAVSTGGEQRAIIVDIDPIRLQAHHISLSEVVKRLAEENLNLPAGIAKQSDTEYIIRSLGWFTSVQDIANVPLATSNGQTIALGDVASVKDSHPETRMYTRLNGKQSVGIVITKQSGANTISTAKDVAEKIKEAQRLYPELKFALAYDQSQFIGTSINDLRNNVVIGGILAVLILLFFLRNIRSTLVVALSIPISIISTFALLYIAHFSLNTMSLSGLALATGLIVDDAVVVLENIFRHIERDRLPAEEAAVSGTNEILTAVVASTLTVIVVFLPLFLIQGQAGQMFTQFALVVVFSLSISLLDATTVVPMLASRLIHGEAHHETLAGRAGGGWLNRWFARFGGWFQALDDSYHSGLRWTLKHRWIVICGAFGITLLSLLLVPDIGVELMPQTDSGDFNITVKMPVGTALSTTNRVVLAVEQIVMHNPNVKSVFAAAGTSLSISGSTTAAIANRGSLQVKLKDNRKESTQEVMNDIRRQTSHIPGARIMPVQFDIVSMLMTGGNQNVEVDIFGSDLSTLSKLSEEVMGRLRGVAGLENLDVNWQEAEPEVQFKVDRAKALAAGVTFTDIANTLATATNGDIATYYQENGFQYPIYVQLPEAQRKTVPELMDLVVTPSLAPASGTAGPGTAGSGAAGSGASGATGATGGTGGTTGGAVPPGATASQGVLLRQVATPYFSMGPSEITRQDRQRYIAVVGQPQGRSPGAIQADVQKALNGVKLPTGYYWAWGISQQRRAQEFGGMFLAVLLAIGLIYMLLASQFESFVHPLTILLSVPLAALGVILAMFLSGRAFGLTAFIGLLMLVGIVVKNGILLIDYTNLLRKHGLSRDEAVLRAGPTRLRPILMTASAAVLGMMPIAMALGRGGEVQAPMATAVVGGLITSTFLTLFVVPAVYSTLDDAAEHFRRWREGQKSRAAENPTLPFPEADAQSSR